MRRRWRTGISCGLASSLVACVLLAADSQLAYSPVAPPSALQASLQANLKYARDWLEGKDFLSAADAAQGLSLLAQLYAHQSTEPRWRERAAALRETAARLAAAAKAKDADACDRLVRECAGLLEELARRPPAGERGDKDFQKFGDNKTWMWLMEGAYGEARWARTPRDMGPFAYTIAEEANALAHLRSDAGWRQMSMELRDAALRAAATAKQNDLPAARQAIKDVRRRCDACHQERKR